MGKSGRPLFLILVLYYALAFTALDAWTVGGWHPVTGDEPHYLVTASALGRYHTTDVQSAYSADLREHRILNWPPDGSGWHAFRGPHGLFSVHGLGLPALLAIPFAIAGITGARVFLVLLSGFVLVLAWKISGIFSVHRWIRFWSTIAVGISLPLLMAANQIYTEIPAGLIGLTGVYWALTAQRRRTWWKELALAFAIAFLPWLHVKLLAAMVVLLCGISWKMLASGRNAQPVLRFASVCAASVALLAAYNVYAFGRLLGPYGGDELQMSVAGASVFVGLFLDQQHGFLLQNPIQFIGLFGIGSLFAFDAITATLWAVLFLTLIVPNGFYPAWYGGWAFFGRFEWTAAIVFYAPTLLGLVRLGQAYPRVFAVLVAVNALFQGQAYYRYGPQNASLINLGIHLSYPPPSYYDLFYQGLARWLPAFVNPEWAFSYLPNCLFMIGAFAIFVGGVWSARKPQHPSARFGRPDCRSAEQRLA